MDTYKTDNQLTIEQQEQLKPLIKQVNEEGEWHEEYILHNPDFTDGYWILVNDIFSYDQPSIQSDMEDILIESDRTNIDSWNFELDRDTYEHLSEWIIDGEIEQDLSVESIDDMYPLYNFPVGEQELQLTRELADKLDALSDGEYQYIRDNVKWYLHSTYRDLLYLNFGYGTFITLYINEQQLIDEYLKYIEA